MYYGRMNFAGHARDNSKSSKHPSLSPAGFPEALRVVALEDATGGVVHDAGVAAEGAGLESLDPGGLDLGLLGAPQQQSQTGGAQDSSQCSQRHRRVARPT